MKNKKKGFTLAEVLITLGIIGVVAAITLPTLMQDASRQQLGSKLAKFSTNLEKITLAAGIDGAFGNYSNSDLSGDGKVDIADTVTAANLKDALINVLNDQMLFKNDNDKLTKYNRVELRDGTAMAVGSNLQVEYVRGGHEEGTYGKKGYPLYEVYFFPNIQGLEKRTAFRFTVTTNGYVLPGDDCTKAIVANKYKATSIYSTENACKRNDQDTPTDKSDDDDDD